MSAQASLLETVLDTGLIHSLPHPMGMQEFRFTVPGEPVAKGRPRITTIGGFARTFTPAKTRNYESEIRYLASEAWGDRDPIDGVPITMAVDVYRSIPASWSNKKQQLALKATVRPIGRPDVDNYLKSAADGLLGVVFRDDALIVEACVRKWYSLQPRMEIVLTWSGDHA